jgi:hypothetical protein
MIDGATSGIMMIFLKKDFPGIVVLVMAYAKKNVITVTMIVVTIET